MSVEVFEFAVIVTGAVIIIGVVIELAQLWLRHSDDDDYDGRTKR